MVAARLSELTLGEVADPRDPRGRRWPLRGVLAAVLVGLAAGSETLRDMERFTANLPRAVRRTLGLRGRLPDTTARNVLVRIEPDALRDRLHQQIRRAHRSQQLSPEGLPCGVVRVDGRSTATPFVDDPCRQSCRHLATGEDGYAASCREMPSGRTPARSCTAWCAP
jgi:hypothetical protein